MTTTSTTTDTTTVAKLQFTSVVFKKKVIKFELYEKLMTLSKQDHKKFLLNSVEYNRLMEHRVVRLKQLFRDQGLVYWSNSKKSYQVLRLMRLSK